MSDQPVSIIVCTSEDMHPYECGGSPCRHCEMRKDEHHDPDYCWLCHDGPPPKERT
jgi:hypothetical protein